MCAFDRARAGGDRCALAMRCALPLRLSTSRRLMRRDAQSRAELVTGDGTVETSCRNCLGASALRRCDVVLRACHASRRACQRERAFFFGRAVVCSGVSIHDTRTDGVRPSYAERFCFRLGRLGLIQASSYLLAWVQVHSFSDSPHPGVHSPGGLFGGPTAQLSAVLLGPPQS